MANFCEACGSQLSGVEVFCWKCGVPVKRGVPQQPQATPQPPVTPPQQSAAAGGYQQVQVPQAPAASYPQPPAAGYQQIPQQAQPPNVQFQNVSAPANPVYAQVPASAPPAPPVKSNTWITVLIVVLAVVFVGGLLAVGGVLYVAHRVSQKVHQISAAAGVSEAPRHIVLESLTHKDACRMLSKQDVSSALGVEIVATRTIADGCEYLAKGTSTDMTARHMAALSSKQGADSKQQEMIRKLAGGVFASQQSESHETGEDSDGNTPVLVFTVDNNSAAAQMKLTGGVMGTLGPGQKPIEGIGDEALDESGAMMLVRKGDKLIRITYTSCPCNTDAIKPLARKLADAV